MTTPPKRPLSIIVERTPYGEVEADLAPAPETVVSVHLVGRPTLEWRTDGPARVGRPMRGQVTVVPRGRSGRLRVRGGACEVLKLGLSDDALAAWAEADERPWNGNPLVDRFAHTDPLVEQIGLALLRDVEARATADTLYQDALTAALVAHLVRHHSALEAASPPRRTVHPLSEPRARRAVAFMEAQLASRIGLDDVARELGLSTSHFSARFKRTFGQSPAQYLTWLRLDRARERLETTKAPVAEIATTLGFRSASHFAQAFRGRFGLPPMAWRDRRYEN